jgi:hypothetical protein
MELIFQLPFILQTMRGKCFEKCITKEEGSLNFIDVVQYPIEVSLQFNDPNMVFIDCNVVVVLCMLNFL